MKTQLEAANGSEAARLSALARSGLSDPATDEAFRPVTTLIQTVYDMPIAFVSTVGETRQHYKCSFGLDVRDLPRDATFCEAVIEGADIVVIEDAPNDPRYRDHPLVTGPMGLRSYLGAPLVSPDGFAIGTVCVAGTAPRRFDARDIQMLRQFATVVIDQSALLQIADRDTLTGAWTRRAFLKAVSREMVQARATGEPASLAVFDLDHFKRINDGYGHRVGDLVLKAAVEICQARMREEQIIGRLGGEEFAVLFSGASLAAAGKAAERMRGGIEGLHLRDPSLPNVTSSFGIAELEPGMARSEDWIEAADRALYRAKAAGRNRVETAEGQNGVRGEV